jgi:hypothetical protein
MFISIRDIRNYLRKRLPREYGGIMPACGGAEVMFPHS